MDYLEYVQLVNTAKFYSYKYYVECNPIITDAEFDALVKSIEEFETEHPEWALPDSPTQKVGSDLSNKNDSVLVCHRTPMLSCQKAQDMGKVNAFLSKTNQKEYAVEWKYDGISCSLVYFNGELIEASTRGDGYQGRNILPHVKLMRNVPSKLLYCGEAGVLATDISHSGRIEVRGEIVCPNAALPYLFDNNGKKYKDTRTAAASLCNKENADQQCSLLEFCPWEVFLHSKMFYGKYEYIMQTETDSMLFLNKLGFVSKVEKVDVSGVTNILDVFEKQRPILPYPVDGVVLKVNDKLEASILGSTRHHPRSNIAYKFPPQTVSTHCTNIEITVGASGRRTPVCHFEPIVINGKTVSKASLGSERCMLEMGVNVGDEIKVGLSNDVTPKVYGVLSSSNCPRSSNATQYLVDCIIKGLAASRSAEYDEEPSYEEEDEEKTSSTLSYKIFVGVCILIAIILLPVLPLVVLAFASFLTPVILGKF